MWCGGFKGLDPSFGLENWFFWFSNWSKKYFPTAVYSGVLGNSEIKALEALKVKKCWNCEIRTIQMAPDLRDGHRDRSTSLSGESSTTFWEDYRSWEAHFLPSRGVYKMKFWNCKIGGFLKKTLTKNGYRVEHDRELPGTFHKFFRVSMSIKWVEKMFSTKMFKCPCRNGVHSIGSTKKSLT